MAFGMDRQSSKFASIVNVNKMVHKMVRDINIHVKVRDQTFMLACGRGEQDMLWLSKVAKYRYSTKHNHINPEQLIATYVSNDNGDVLFPHHLVKNKLKDGDTIVVEMLGPNIGANSSNFTRQKSLWELYAYTPEHEYVPVIISFDSSSLDLPEDHSISIMGSFNAWEHPVPMVEKKEGTWLHRASYPAGAELTFIFCSEASFHLSNHYTIIDSGSKDTPEVNYIKIKPPAANYAELLAVHPEPEDYYKKDDVKFKVADPTLRPKLGINPSLSEEQKQCLFDIDCSLMAINDVCQDEEKRDDVFKKLWTSYDPIRKIFRYYSSQGGKNITYMNCINFINFCKACKIPDQKQCTITRLDELFRRVNLEEEYVAEVARPGSRAAGKAHRAINLKSDPLNPDNQFIRAEFMETLVRISVLKYKSLSPHSALNKFIGEYLTPNLGHIQSTEYSVSSEMGTASVQTVLWLFHKRLYKLHYEYRQPRTEHILTKSFLKMMSQHGLLGEELSIRECVMAFSMAQEEVKNEDQANQYEMTYVEFLECLGRIAETLFKADKFPGMRFCDKLQELLQRLFPQQGGLTRASGGGGSTDYTSSFQSKGSILTAS